MASVEEKVGELKLDDKKPEEVKESLEEVKETVLEELKDSPPELQHVETTDTTDPTPGDSTTTEGVVKAEVPEVFKEELKKDLDIVPDSTEAKDTKPEVVDAKPEEPVTPEESK